MERSTPEFSSLAAALRRSWCRETSYDPSRWSSKNAAWGQCAVTALIVQDHFGGELLTGEVNGIPHFWNLLPDGQEVDLTLGQFGFIHDRGPRSDSTRSLVLSFPDTVARYLRLRVTVDAALDSKSSVGSD